MKTIIKNGIIIDRNNQIMDIEITDSFITKIENNIDTIGYNRIIDATGLHISSGFIDMHSHSDIHIANSKYASNKIAQGITSELTGHCGVGTFPVSELHNTLQNIGLYSNILSLIPHGSLRDMVTDKNYSPMTKPQMQKAKDLIKSEMDCGAFGISTGLIYNPGISASTDELIELCSILKEYGGIYFTHMRSESDDILEALDEAIKIGQETGIQIHISHLKIMGQKNFDKIDTLLKKIDDARKNGVRIYADQYPYNASMTTLNIMLPDDIYKDISLLDNPANKDRVIAWLSTKIKARGGCDNIILVDMIKTPELNGKTLSEISQKLGITPENAIYNIIKQEIKNVAIISQSISNENIEKIMTRNDVAIGTDGTIYDKDLEANHTPHPREYGTFPKIIHKYVNSDNILTLNDAIYKMATLPANILSLPKMGKIEEGNYADIVLFDKNTIKDTATYENPKQYPIGIPYVFINGQIAIDNNNATMTKCGRVIKKSQA